WRRLRRPHRQRPHQTCTQPARTRQAARRKEPKDPLVMISSDPQLPSPAEGAVEVRAEYFLTPLQTSSRHFRLGTFDPLIASPAPPPSPRAPPLPARPAPDLPARAAPARAPRARALDCAIEVAGTYSIAQSRLWLVSQRTRERQRFVRPA